MFSINCNNKGCFKTQEPKLKIDTNEVICSECGGTISNVSDFTKRQMKSLGQVVKESAQKKAFAVKCDSCKTSDTPIVENDAFICKKCKQKINISPIFANILRNNIKDAPE